MLPTKVPADMPEADRARYRVVRLDTFAELSGQVFSADAVEGSATMLDPKSGARTTHNLGAGGIAIIARALALAIVLAGAAACSQFGMFVQGDLANAASLAQQRGDSAASVCAANLAADLQPSPNPADDGVFTFGERKRLVVADLKSEPCAPIVAQVFADKVRALPFLGNAFGAAGF